MHETKTIQEVADAYALGTVEHTRHITVGLVNNTYLVTTQYGIYIFQQLNSVFKKEVTLDHKTIVTHLNEHGFLAPNLILTTSNAPYFECAGETWKACGYIPHDQHITLTDKTAISAAIVLARFHKISSKLNYVPVHTLQHFHDTPHILRHLESVFTNSPFELQTPISDWYSIIKRNIPKYFLTNQDECLIHGDPKFDNMLFVHERAVGMLDFDTCMIGSPLLDIGDAFRSWCRFDQTKFNQGRFESVACAYRSAFGSSYNDETMLRAVALITLELAARYLIDYIEDSYFAWNPKYSSRREQNKQRCIRYTKYFLNMGFN